jgi:hypothetical protein
MIRYLLLYNCCCRVFVWHPLCREVRSVVSLLLKFKLYCDRRSVGQIVFMSGPHLGSMNRFLLLSDLCGLPVVERPPWREDRSVIYSYNSLSLSGPSPAGLMTTSYCLILRLPQPGGTGSRIYIPPKQPQQTLNLLVKEERCRALFYMSMYTFTHNLLNVLVQIANNRGFKRKKYPLGTGWSSYTPCIGFDDFLSIRRLVIL